jgi:hypothetical protein
MAVAVAVVAVVIRGSETQQVEQDHRAAMAQLDKLQTTVKVAVAVAEQAATELLVIQALLHLAVWVHLHILFGV